MPRPQIGKISHFRLTPETEFYIDYEWWEKSNIDIKTYLQTRLQIGDKPLNLDVESIDLIDEETGAIHQIDGFQFAVSNYFQESTEDIIAQTSFVDAVFCVLLANGNKPMSAIELATKVQRSPDLVLKTLGGATIYQGIRPIIEE